MAKAPMSNLTVYYDASCGICSRFADAVRRRDREQLITFVDNTAPAASFLPSDLTARTVVAVDETASCTVEAQAIAEILKRLPRYRIIAAAITLPGVRVLANAVYRLVARYRDRISSALGLTVCPLRDRPHS